ncbi:MAG: hypothetical protein CMH53_01015 [Myxococcales bacterium]|nr:hypothetical protein [Myxococcales bacterium]
MNRRAALVLWASLGLCAVSVLSESAQADAATPCGVAKGSLNSRPADVQTVKMLLAATEGSVAHQRRALLSLAKSTDLQARELIYGALEHRSARIREAAVWALSRRRLTIEAIAAIVGRGLVEWHAGTRHAITQTLRHFVASAGGHITRSIHE